MLVIPPTPLAQALAGIAAELASQAAALAPARGPLAAARARLLAAFIRLIAALQALVEAWLAGKLPSATPRRRPATTGRDAPKHLPVQPNDTAARRSTARTAAEPCRAPARPHAPAPNPAAAARRPSIPRTGPRPSRRHAVPAPTPAMRIFRPLADTRRLTPSLFH